MRAEIEKFCRKYAEENLPHESADAKLLADHLVCILLLARKVETLTPIRPTEQLLQTLANVQSKARRLAKKPQSSPAGRLSGITADIIDRSISQMLREVEAEALKLILTESLNFNRPVLRTRRRSAYSIDSIRLAIGPPNPKFQFRIALPVHVFRAVEVLSENDVAKPFEAIAEFLQKASVRFPKLKIQISANSTSLKRFVVRSRKSNFIFKEMGLEADNTSRRKLMDSLIELTDPEPI